MQTIQRYFSLLLVGLISACMNLPEVENDIDPRAEDTVHPSLTRSVPLPGATGISLDTGLEFEFSEPMNIDTVQVAISPTASLGVPAWLGGGTRLALQPSTSLEPSTTYTVTVSGKDGAGNELTGTRIFSFTTAGAVDTTSPSITSSIPANQSTQVALDTVLEFEFSEPMNVDMVQASISPTVTLGAPSWSDGNTRLNLQPGTNLAQNTPYTITVTGKDLAGNSIAGNRIISFTTTGSAPDSTPPESLGHLPENLATGVERTASITILFSEPMDTASVEGAFAITSPLGFSSGTFAWNNAGTEMTYKPNADFEYGVDVNWQVSTAAKDLSGNTLQASITGTFRTIKTKTIIIEFDQNTSGSLGSPVYFRQSHIYNFELVGDSYDNGTYRLFIGFKLDSLPEDTIRITRSTLKWWVSQQYEDPFSAFGNLLLEQVYIGEQLDGTSIEGNTNPDAEADFHTTALSTPIIVPPNVATTNGLFDITELVTKDWANRAGQNRRTQYRLRFEQASDGDGVREALLSQADTQPKLAELEVTYEYP